MHLSQRSSGTGARTDSGRIAPAVAAQIAICLSGVAAIVWFNGTFGVSRYLFVTVDIPGFVIGALTAIILVAVVYLMPERSVRRLAEVQIDRLPVAAVVLATGAVSAFATLFVYHGYALSMDEWMPRLQSKLFLSGALTGQLAPEWRDYGRAMFHVFATYDPQTGQVASSYRPGMAALYSAFDLVGLGIYASAILNAGAVGLAAVVTRQLRPQSRTAPVVAALLLATSQQALAGSLTSYAMTGHLFLNLLWLHLFLRDTMRMHLLAALVGVVTASLHQVHVHIFFALPFLLTLLRPFRPRLIVLYGLVYLFGHLAVLSWDRVLIAQVADQGTGGARNTLDILAAIGRLPDLSDLASIWANLTRLAGWQSLALLPLLLALWRSGERAPWTGLLLASVMTSLLPYVILMPDQGHGWGYRYLHGLLGNFAILAAVGWDVSCTKTARPRYRAAVMALLLVSPLVMLPLRAVQIENFVEPYAAATRLTMSQDADVVIVDSLRVFVGVDIPRNDPLSQGRPVAMSLRALEPGQIADLCRSYDVTFLSVDVLGPLGLVTFAKEDLYDQTGYEERMVAMKGSGCHAGS